MLREVSGGRLSQRLLQVGFMAPVREFGDSDLRRLL
jgi:hypothetical protein